MSGRRGVFILLEKVLKDNGVINFYKPPGITSHQATKKVQRILGASKAGHAGTVDSFAEGILLICLNDATRIAEYLLELEKEYVARVQLGKVTDTYDITGRIIEEENPDKVTEEDILRVLKRFAGETMQIPPMYSAIKLKGVPLHKLARKGLVIQRQERRVTISMIELLKYEPPEFVIKVRCSKGTYIRSLAYDIGKELGVGAVVKGLKRTAIGDFNEEGSATFEALVEGQFTLFAMDEALGHLEEITLNDRYFRLASHGTAFSTGRRLPKEELFRLKDPSGKFFAIGRSKDDGFIKIEKVFTGTGNLK